MAREIKFRAWTKAKEMRYNVVPFQWDYCINTMWHKCIESNGAGFLGHSGTEAKFEVGGFNIVDGALMQYTGLKDKNGKEIYESDIFRIEEDGAEDGTDQIFYVVITWIQEWCMFGTLRADEYHTYLSKGSEALDEPMFWTYTLEDTDSRKHYLCGNIYSNPELLKQ